MSLSTENVRVFCKTLPGARVENMFENAHFLTNKYLASEVILHVGTNNLVNTDPSMLVTQIESLADQILVKCPTVLTIALSSIIPRKTFQKELVWKTYEANWLLDQLAARRGWKFIEHDAIDPEKHLASDGIHLNAEGVRLIGCAISDHVHGVSQSSIMRPGFPLLKASHGTSSPAHDLYADVTATSKHDGGHGTVLIPSITMNNRPTMTMNSYTGCYNCGELNHKQKRCRYETKLKCNSCFQYGHKAKFCSNRQQF